MGWGCGPSSSSPTARHRRRHAPPRLARRQGVGAAPPHGRRRAGVRTPLCRLPRQRDVAVLLLPGAPARVAVHSEGHHQPRPRHHLRHRRRHRVLLLHRLHLWRRRLVRLPISPPFMGWMATWPISTAQSNFWAELFMGSSHFMPIIEAIPKG